MYGDDVETASMTQQRLKKRSVLMDDAQSLLIVTCINLRIHNTINYLLCAQFLMNFAKFLKFSMEVSG